MTTTYTGDFTSLLEQIRFEFGDTTTPFKFTDEEIEYVITLEHTVLNSAARLCEIYATKCADSASRQMGPLRVELKERVQSYLARAKALRSGMGRSAKPYAGGVYQADEDNFEANTSLIQPIFGKGLMDNE